MFSEIDLGSSITLVATAVLAGAAMALADRFPRLTRAFVLFATLALAIAAVYASILVPWLGLYLLGIFVVGNMAHGYAATTSRFRVKPAPPGSLRVWAREVAELEAQGWTHAGTWLLDGGQTRPVWSIVRRPQDHTQVGMLGTAAPGGVITIDTILDDGRGLLVTLRGSSSALRPHWLFRQEIKGASLTEMVKHHEDALFFLQAHGVVPSATVPAGALEFESYTTRKFRRHYKRRWWLWAIRPIARRLGARTTGPLHEQPSIAKQVEQYRAATESEPPISGQAVIAPGSDG